MAEEKKLKKPSALRSLRQSKGMTMMELSRRTGVPIATLSLVERGWPIKDYQKGLILTALAEAEVQE